MLAIAELDGWDGGFGATTGFAAAIGNCAAFDAAVVVEEVAGFAEDFVAPTTGFEVSAGFAVFVGRGVVAFVDFWRTVVFLDDSEATVSIGSVTTFFGRPRFLTTSADIFATLEGPDRCRGVIFNFEVVVGNLGKLNRGVSRQGKTRSFASAHTSDASTSFRVALMNPSITDIGVSLDISRTCVPRWR